MTLSDLCGAFLVWEYRIWAELALGGLGLFVFVLLVGGVNNAWRVTVGLVAGVFAGLWLAWRKGTRPGKLSGPKEPTP